MEEYLLIEPIPIPPASKSFRWSWFALGCGCLFLGMTYLSVVDLNGGTIVQAPAGALVFTKADP